MHEDEAGGALTPREDARGGRTAPLSREDLNAILAVCREDATLCGARDGALIALAWAAQASLREVISITVRGAMRCAEKTDGEARQAIVRWSAERCAGVEWFLQTIDRRGQVTRDPMRATTAGEVIRRRAAVARVGYVTPQDLLRSAVVAASGALTDTGGARANERP